MRRMLDANGLEHIESSHCLAHNCQPKFHLRVCDIFCEVIDGDGNPVASGLRPAMEKYRDMANRRAIKKAGESCQ